MLIAGYRRATRLSHVLEDKATRGLNTQQVARNQGLFLTPKGTGISYDNRPVSQGQCAIACAPEMTARFCLGRRLRHSLEELEPSMLRHHSPCHPACRVCRKTAVHAAARFRSFGAEKCGANCEPGSRRDLERGLPLIRQHIPTRFGVWSQGEP